jgi:hypothetical protein
MAHLMLCRPLDGLSISDFYVIFQPGLFPFVFKTTCTNMHLYDTYTYAPIAMKNVYQMTNAPYIDTSVQNPLTAFSFNKNNRILRFKCKCSKRVGATPWITPWKVFISTKTLNFYCQYSVLQ